MEEPPRFQHHTSYTIGEACILVLVVAFIIVIITVGNVFVIMAIFRDATLRTLQNYFVGIKRQKCFLSFTHSTVPASLALADLLVGLVVVPFSLAQVISALQKFFNNHVSGGHGSVDLWFLLVSGTSQFIFGYFENTDLPHRLMLLWMFFSALHPSSTFV